MYTIAVSPLPEGGHGYAPDRTEAVEPGPPGAWAVPKQGSAARTGSQPRAYLGGARREGSGGDDLSGAGGRAHRGLANPAGVPGRRFAVRRARCAASGGPAQVRNQCRGGDLGAGLFGAPCRGQALDPGLAGARSAPSTPDEGHQPRDDSPAAKKTASSPGAK